MELASMLAGERFSDHPGSVSPTIAAFLRAYNDSIDDRRRQDLYSYAARIVGTAASAEIEDARIAALLAWTDLIWEQRPRFGISCMRRRRADRRRRPDAASAARCAMNSLPAPSDATHAAVLAMVDELIDMGSSPGSSVGDQTGQAGASAPRDTAVAQGPSGIRVRGDCPPRTAGGPRQS